MITIAENSYGSQIGWSAGTHFILLLFLKTILWGGGQNTDPQSMDNPDALS